MTATVIDIDKPREGRPSPRTLELYRLAAKEQRAELRVRKDETAQMVEAIEPHLLRLELLARAVGIPTAMQSAKELRAAVETHANRWGVTPPRTA